MRLGMTTLKRVHLQFVLLCHPVFATTNIISRARGRQRANHHARAYGYLPFSHRHRLLCPGSLARALARRKCTTTWKPRAVGYQRLRFLVYSYHRLVGKQMHVISLQATIEYRRCLLETTSCNASFADCESQVQALIVDHFEDQLMLICSISLFVILVHVVLALPPHEVAREGEHNGVHSAPSNENAKVYTQA